MRKFSACLDMLFKDEADDFGARIPLARAAGFDAIEFWRWSDKDIDAVAAAAEGSGLAVTAILAEPLIALTDAANKTTFSRGCANRSMSPDCSAPVRSSPRLATTSLAKAGASSAMRSSTA